MLSSGKYSHYIRNTGHLFYTVNNVLELLQRQLEVFLSGSTLEVYVAALSMHKGPIDDLLLGTHKLVPTFLIV